ncbi:MAG: CsbD family protein [Rhodopirellula sp.]|nr:CsbD family protein [Rhodopirellula sp.]
MSGKTDKVKGRIKEAAGALTDDDQLRAEGKTDQAVGKVKEVVQTAVDKVKDVKKKLTE